MTQEAKTKWDKLTSDIYCFADDLAQAMLDADDESQAGICYLVGLDPNEVQWLADADEGYSPCLLKLPYLAKQIFQQKLGIDPADSTAPWPPEFDGTEVEDYADSALPDLTDEDIKTQALNLLVMLQDEVYSPATYHETGLSEEIDIQRMLAAIHNLLYDLWAEPVES